MSSTERKISLTRTSKGEYTATNDRGGTLNPVSYTHLTLPTIYSV